MFQVKRELEEAGDCNGHESSVCASCPVCGAGVFGSMSKPGISVSLYLLFYQTRGMFTLSIITVCFSCCKPLGLEVNHHLLFVFFLHALQKKKPMHMLTNFDRNFKLKLRSVLFKETTFSLLFDVRFPINSVFRSWKTPRVL